MLNQASQVTCDMSEVFSAPDPELSLIYSGTNYNLYSNKYKLVSLNLRFTHLIFPLEGVFRVSRQKHRTHWSSRLLRAGVSLHNITVKLERMNHKETLNQTPEQPEAEH